MVWSFDSQLQLNCQEISCLHEFSFQFFDEQMNWCIFRHKSMKSVSIQINRWTKRVCHRFLPIVQRNRYQSNQIHRLLSIYRLINRYRFFSIDFSGYITSIMTKGLVANGGVYESEIGGDGSTGYLIWNHPRLNMNDFVIENLSAKRLTR